MTEPTGFLGLREYARIFGLVSNRDMAQGSFSVSLRDILKAGENYQKVVSSPLVIFVQNTALLPISYKGTNRERVIQSLIANLSGQQPDVVGLTEVFVNDEKDQIKSALAAIYPYSLKGPNEADLEQDGG